MSADSHLISLKKLNYPYLFDNKDLLYSIYCIPHRANVLNVFLNICLYDQYHLKNS
jgi:hypothetical protein